jgi:hypothetical protein
MVFNISNIFQFRKFLKFFPRFQDVKDISYRQTSRQTDRRHGVFIIPSPLLSILDIQNESAGSALLHTKLSEIKENIKPGTVHTWAEYLWKHKE